ncbi:MAG: Ig-like domain-containing protein [Planctomycetaceae bacterium]
MGCESLETRALLSAITGTIYEDVDSSGTKTGPDNTLGGWQVYVDLDNSGTLNSRADGTPEPSVFANSGGDYTINMNGFPTGTYRVAEIVQPGWSPTAATSRDVAFTSSQDSNKVDFFNFAGGDIVGTVWNDLNADGIRAVDPITGEFTDPGLEGWTVFIDMKPAGGGGLNGIPDPGEPTTTTDASGQYHFSNLPAGDYEVTEVQPAGWDVPSGRWDTKQTVAVNALTTATQDYANFSLINGSISGSVWNDLNIDGVRETDPITGDFTEPGLADWTIFLDTNNNGVLDPTETSTVTDTDGNYSFISLAAGDYEVTEVIPAGWDVSPTYDSRQTVAVRGGRNSTANDFANFTVENGSIRGTVWNDLFRDGIRNSDISGAFTDPGLAGWTVYLDMNRNGAFDSTEPTAITDVDGHYLFPGLQVGEYEVIEIVPTGWETAPTFGDNYSVRVYSGAESVAHDFANFNLSTLIPGTVSGTVWNDVNANGIIDSTPSAEPGLGGRIVFADLNSNGIPDASEPQTTTNPDGTYTISGVAPGTVNIVDVLPAGWRATSPVTSVRSLVLKNGENKTGINYGTAELKNSTISGAVFADTNKNGIRDAGEHGLAGITVYLDMNNSGTLDAGDLQTTTSADLYYTPSINEAGSYSFDHLASGTYSIRQIIPVELSATPTTQFEHSVTMVASENHSGVDFADVFRLNEIHGVKFEDANGNHVRDADEVTVAGTTIFIDSNRNNVLDADEMSTITGSDGSYSFTGLTPGAYVVREVVESGFGITFPTTSGGTLWPAGVSNPAVGNVSPTSITTSLIVGQSYNQTVSLTLPDTGALTNAVDVFLLFDDTGSFTNNSPIVRAAFPDIITQLQTSLSGTDLAFGVGRFEEYGNFASEYGTGRPFVLNQPIVAASTPGYLTAIQAALNRTTPGYGGDGPETDIEALYQLVTGIGFDGNNNGSVMDSGAAGLGATQLLPGNSGDVPSFVSFTADASSNVLPAAGTVGGGGFRAGALPVILLATDTGFAYQPKGETTITGANGLTLPVSDLTETSRGTTPFSSGAGLQETITGLNALGALVIGLGTNTQSNVDPRQGLEAISKLTGAINRSTTPIDNGTGTPIAPGDPLYFQISTGFAGSVAAGVQNAIQNAVTNVAMDITVQASDPRVHIINHTGTRTSVGSGQTASFDIEFVGDGIPHRFDLQFVREGTNVVLGSIPVVLGTPIPGDGYHFDDLGEGEIELEDHFGDHASGASTANVAPSFVAGSNQVAPEDAGIQTVMPWATGISPGPASEASQTVNFVVVSNDNTGLFSVQPAISADGVLTFTSAPDAFGTATLSVVLHDNGGTANGGTDTSAPQQFTIHITAVNDTPAVVDDFYSSPSGDIVIVAAPGVLANDSDVDGDLLSVTPVTSPVHGSLTLSTSGSFSYIPDAGFSGTDSFTYVANDGTVDSALATVAIAVTAANSAPTAAGDHYATNEDVVLIIDLPGVLGNDTDIDGDPLTARVVTDPSHGSLTLNPDGSFIYTSVPNFNGIDSFTYTANDGTVDSAAATVTITVAPVNDLPVAIPDDYNTSEDVPLDITLPGILSNDLDADGDPLTARLISVPAHGTLTVNPDGSFNYVPDLNFNGSDSFTYVANDGVVDSEAAKVTIRVAAVNDAPVATPDRYSISEDNTLTVVIPGVLNNDTDIDGDALTGRLVAGPTHGTLLLDSNGHFTYTPALNYNGTDTFTYVANDGSLDSAPTTVTITVTAVNDAPLAIGEDFAVDAGTVLNITLPGILANDSDVDGDGLTAVLVAGPSNGSLILNADGSLSYTPATGFSGTDSFTYVANDGSLNSETATVTLTVNPILPPPTGDMHFLVVDTSSRRTFEYDEAGGVLNHSRLNTEDQKPRGIATNSNGTLRWVIDEKGEVFVYNDSNVLLGSWEFEGVDKAQGIAINGNDLWVVDSSNDRAYLFSGAASRRSGSASPDFSFALSNSNRNAKDLVTDGEHIWIVNDTASVDRVFRYSMAGTPDGSWVIDSANTQPTGIALSPDGTGTLWIVDSLSDRVYGYDVGTTRFSGNLSATHQFALNSLDRNAQGIATVVPPVSTGLASPASVLTPIAKATASSLFDDPAEMSMTIATSDSPSTRTTTARIATVRIEVQSHDDDTFVKSEREVSGERPDLEDSLLDEAFGTDDLFLLLGS